MKVYRLRYVTRLKIGIEDGWDFFSTPNNLSIITPPSLRFEVMSDVPRKIYAGMVAVYRVRPLFGVPMMTWLTLITHVNEPYLFIDEQRIGPYKFWHHEHRFWEVKGGVEIEDLIHYSLPLGPIGRLINWLTVSRQLERIFAFRQKVLLQRFGEATG
jgi:ligand-binding SRPBCC domain-containing protein